MNPLIRFKAFPLLMLTLTTSFSTLGQKAYLPDRDDQQQLLDEHNYWREQVGVPPLSWSNELAEVAGGWAEQLVKDGCSFRHSKGQYGENLWKGTTGFYSIADVVSDWGNEKSDYVYRTNQCKGVCGHYTQIVWDNTTEVGCASIECDGFTTWVCNYNPPGNYIGEKPY